METVAPVSVDIRYKTLKYGDAWSYQVKMDFNFDNHKDAIKDYLLVENGVYTFESENHARVEAKRMGQQMREYFIEKIGNLIVEVYRNDNREDGTNTKGVC